MPYLLLPEIICAPIFITNSTNILLYRIIAVGVTDAVNKTILKDEVISDPVDESYFSVDDFDQLNRIIDK